MEKPKYVCSVEYYPNCRSCDGGFSGGLEFFHTAKEMLDWAIKRIDTHAIEDVYLTTGELLNVHLVYETGGHRCSGIRIEVDGKKFRTIDDGHGNLKWEEE